MRTFKKALLVMGSFGVVGFFAIGTMNSIVVNKGAFFKNEFNIKFAKRLDDLNGEVVYGRMAASIPKWDPTKSLQKKKLNTAEKLVTAKMFQQKAKDASKKQDKKIQEVVKAEVPEPAIDEARNLSLTGGLFNKKPLVNGKGYSGKANVVNGIIEEIDVVLPGGKRLLINTNDRMVGNVFQYEDTETREMRSGLLYKVKEGQYMVTLTDDTNFAGLRLEFKAEAGTYIEDRNNYSNWAMNDQNRPEDNPDLDVNNYEDDSYEADMVEEKRDEWAEKQENEELEVYDYENENFEETEHALNDHEGDFVEERGPAQYNETEEFFDEEYEVEELDDEVSEAGKFSFNFQKQS